MLAIYSCSNNKTDPTNSSSFISTAINFAKSVITKQNDPSVYKREGTQPGYEYAEEFLSRMSDLGIQPYTPPSTTMLSSTEKEYLDSKPYGDVRIVQISSTGYSLIWQERQAIIDMFAVIRYIMNESDFEDRLFNITGDIGARITTGSGGNFKTPEYLINHDKFQIFPAYKELNRQRFMRLLLNASFNIRIAKRTVLMDGFYETGARAQAPLGMGLYAYPDEYEEYWLKTTGRNGGETIEIAEGALPDEDPYNEGSLAPRFLFARDLFATLFHEMIHMHGYGHDNNNYSQDLVSSMGNIMQYMLESTTYQPYENAPHVVIPDEKYSEMISIYRKMYADIIDAPTS